MASFVSGVASIAMKSFPPASAMAAADRQVVLHVDVTVFGAIVMRKVGEILMMPLPGRNPLQMNGGRPMIASNRKRQVPAPARRRLQPLGH